MKNMKTIKFILNVLMTLAVLTLYSKSLFGMNYHEVVGLFILLPIIVHIAINAKLVSNMYKNYQKVPLSIKLCLIVDIILLVIFLWVGISGVLISRTILTGISSKNMIFKATHQMLGKVTCVLLGIHIGLHLSWRKIKPWIAIVLTVIALSSAVLGFVNNQGGRGKNGHNQMHGEMQINPNNSQGENATEGMPQFDGDVNSEVPEFNNGEMPENQKPDQMPSGMGNQSSVTQKIFTISKFFGLMSSTAMVMYWIIALINRKTV